jgi:CobQ-like glutamine amidotransferase family enzyme
VTARAITIVDVHPGAFFPQGDGGNALVLAWRARRRGVEVTEIAVPLGRRVPPGDLYLIGGAEDEDQPRIAARLAAEGDLTRAAGAGAVVLGVGAGYQLLGRDFEDAAAGVVPGLGLLDVSTRLGPLVDRRVATFPNASLGLPAMSGYEHHRGRTVVGPAAAPLAGLEVGTGNGDDPATDGAVGGRIVGTYLHGPVLARNPELADLLLGWALGGDLEPLGDRESRFAAAVREQRLAEARRYARER